MYTTILWDIDNTLLNFNAAEHAAIRALFAEMELGECTDEQIAMYSEINMKYWRRLERGEITKPEVLLGRFREFFTLIGVDPGAAEEFNKRYQVALGDTIVYYDNSLELIKSLRGRVRQYVVSNGTVIAQTKKLRLSGLGELMDGVFLSEELGAEKPSPVFFEKALATVEEKDPRRMLIVGDSLTSDILGGVNAGIDTCWYNPKGLPRPEGLRIDHEIKNLWEITGLL